MNLKTAFTLKRILLAVAIVILLLCIACVSVLLIKHHKKLDRFNKAKQAYLDEKYEDAKPLLRECLKDQYNDEEVNVMLAKIAENEEEWAAAVWYWQRSTKLNPFKPEYFDSYINALKMTRDFRVIAEVLELKASQNDITQEQYLLLAFSQYSQEGQAKAHETFEKVTDEDVKKTELGEIVSFIMAMDSSNLENTQKTEQTLNFLKKFHDSSDRFISFETLYISALQYARIRDLENGRKCMERAAQVSPLLGRPLLAFYLYQQGFISDAMEIFEEYAKSNTPNEVGVTLGECYVMTQQPEKLAELRKQFTSGNNNRITTGLYLEALHAFMVQDTKAVTQDVAKWQDSFSSTISTLVKLYAATCSDNVEETKKHLLYILNLAPNSGITKLGKNEAEQPKDNTANENNTTTLFFNSRNYAFNIGFRYVVDLVTKNQTMKAAEIAVVLKQFGPRPTLPNQPNPDKLLTELEIGYKLQKGTLTKEDVANVLAKYPDNPLILNYIARYYESIGEFEKATAIAQSNLNRLHEEQKKQVAEGNQPKDLTPFAVNLLGSLEMNYAKLREDVAKLQQEGKTAEAKELRGKMQKQLDETRKAAKALLAEQDAIASNIIYIDFCFRNRLRDDLKEYAATIKDDESDDMKALKYFARAQEAIMPDPEDETAAAPAQAEDNKKELTEDEQKKLLEAEREKLAAEFAKNKADVAKHLDNIVTAHPSILYKVALLYAAYQHYEKANATYQKIIDLRQQATDIIYLNMSENCSALNDKEKALEYAQKAIDLSPNKSLPKEVYAIRLFENDNEQDRQKAYDTLDSLVMAKTATERGLSAWYILQQEKIAKSIETKDWGKIRTEANHLLSVIPKDTRALEALKQADDLMKEEIDKEKENDKEKQED